MFNKAVKLISFNLRYLGNPPWDTGISPPELIRFINNHQPGRALDLGAGTGTNMLTLARSGWQVEGVEYAIFAACRAMRKLKGEGFSAKIYIKDASRLDFLENTYDLILDIGCFHTLNSSKKKVYAEQTGNLLNFGGTLLIYAFLKSDEFQTGLDDENLSYLEKHFELVERIDGQDHGERPSTWLQFRKC